MKRLSYFFILSRLFLACSVACFNDKLLSIVNDVEYTRGISLCTKFVAPILYTSSNDVSIIVSNRSHRSFDIAREIIPKTFTKRNVKLFTEFPAILPDFLGRDSSFMVIDNKANLYRRMSNQLAKRWAEYIIVIRRGTIKWLEKFAHHLSNLQFLNVTFIHAPTKGRSVIIRLMKNSSSPNSPRTLKIFDICNATSSRKKFKKILKNSFLVESTSTERVLRFARLVENTEDPKDFAFLRRGKISSFGIDVLRLFADKKKMKLERYEWPNQTLSTWTDGMKRCLNNEFDFFYAVLPPSMNATNEDIEATAWYKYESINFIDRPRQPVLLLTDILIPYRGIVWLCTFVIFGTFALFAYSINNLWRRGLSRERITVLQIWAIFVDHSLPSLPVKIGLRFVFGMWILHNLMRNSGYTAVFSSSLTATDISKLLKSFQDIVDSGRPVCGSSKAKQLLNDRNDPALRAIHAKFEAIAPTMVFDAVFNRSYIGTRHLSFVERHNQLNRANESLRLYTVSDATIIRYPSFYFAKKGNPYSKELKKIISRAHAHGIINYIDQKYSVLLDKTSFEMALSPSGHFLRLSHLLFLFELLGVGHLVSFLVFIVELCCHAKFFNKFTERIINFINFLWLLVSRR